jgi:hypothetical protein
MGFQIETIWNSRFRRPLIQAIRREERAAMLRSVAIAMMIPLAVAAGPAAAQSAPQARSTLNLTTAEPALVAGNRGFDLSIGDYVDESGARQKRRGIVFGREIAPNATVGIGLFERSRRSHLGPQLDTVTQRRSRGAAVGLSVRF